MTIVLYSGEFSGELSGEFTTIHYGAHGTLVLGVLRSLFALFLVESLGGAPGKIAIETQHFEG